jgi:hypothetical protein
MLEVYMQVSRTSQYFIQLVRDKNEVLQPSAGLWVCTETRMQ